MKTQIFERIAQSLQSLGYSERAFAKLANLECRTINKQLKGESALSSLTIEGIATVFPTLSMEWLIRGNGDMYIDQTVDHQHTDDAPAPPIHPGTTPPDDSATLAAALQVIEQQSKLIAQQQQLITQLQSTNQTNTL